jgi:hypothetical protein
MAIDVLQQYLGRVTIDDDTKNFSVGAFAITLTTGNYYVTGYSGEATAQLVEHMQAQIRAADATLNASTVEYDKDAITGVGPVVMSLDGSGGPVVATITWTDSALQTLLGFTGTQSGASTYTATNQPRGCWRPTLGWAEYPLNATKFWTPRSTSFAGASKDGTTYSTEGTLVNEAPMVRYENLPEADVITPGTGTIQRDLQEFWKQIAHKGQPIRIFPNRTLNASDSYHTGLLVPFEEDEHLGSFTDFVGRRIRAYNGLWDVQLRFKEYVT